MNRGQVWLNFIPPVIAPDVVSLAVATANTIAERPSTIVVKRDTGEGNYVTLPEQTVRIEVVQSIRDSGENRDAMVAISKQYVVMMGFRAHPTIPDTDLQRGDTFYFQNRVYQVQEIIDTLPGRLMASADLTP